MPVLEPELEEALRKAWHGASARGTVLADTVLGDAHARAEVVYEIVRFLYDEAKFRTPMGPPGERENLAEVGNAARGYADEMFALTGIYPREPEEAQFRSSDLA